MKFWIVRETTEQEIMQVFLKKRDAVDFAKTQGLSCEIERLEMPVTAEGICDLLERQHIGGISFMSFNDFGEVEVQS